MTDSGRDRVVDTARGIAVLSMIEAHTNPGLGPIDLLVEFVTAPTFALLLGCGLALAWRRRHAGRGHPLRSLARASLVRGACLVLLGLLLERPTTNVIVVLVPLGVTTALMPPLVALGWRVRTALAGLLWAVTAPLASVGRTWLAAHPGTPAPGQYLVGLVTSDYYRITTFVALALLGTLVVDLRERNAWARSWRLGLAALAVGAACAGGQLLGLWDAKDYDPQPASVATTAALALLVLALADLMTQLVPPLARWLADSGAAALSLYAVQIVALAAYVRVRPELPVRAPGLWVTLTLLVLVLPALWRAAARAPGWRRGPLEGEKDGLVRLSAGSPRNAPPPARSPRHGSR